MSDMGKDLQASPSEGANDSRRALIWALVLNAAFLVIEVVVGFASGSLALLSDAAHMVTDVGALALALAAAQLARREATPNRSFGLRRAEVLGAFANALFLLFTCVLIFREAVTRLISGPTQISGWPVLVVGAVGLAVNLGSAWYLARSDRDNLNVRAALAHMLADALGSVGAILAAVLILAGFAQADAIVSLAVGALILVGAWRLIMQASRVLLQFAPDSVCCNEVLSAITAVPGVDDVHDLHIWSLDHRQTVASVHVVAEPGAAPGVRERVASLLADRFGIEHSTVQTERDGENVCAKARCPLQSPTGERAHGCGGHCG